MGLLSAITSLFGHADEDALSVPAMDGVFKPNNRLETAERVVELPGIDNLIAVGDALWCSSGGALVRVDPQRKTSETLRRFGGAITMAAASKAGAIAIGIEGGGLELLEPAGGSRRLDLPEELRSCITAGLFRDEDNLTLAVGSRRYAKSDWQRDLMSRGATGAVVNYRISTGAVEVVRDNLAFPYGLALQADGGLAASESWRHRIVSLSPSAGPTGDVLLAELPAYPARLAPASDGGYWLALFAPRRQLTEFVLREDDYRREMMATIAPQAWIGPDFSDGGGEEQPLQAGSVRQMGMMKPWAPSRSYGLVAHLDQRMNPTASFHSRADGAMHGVASLIEFNGRLYAASRGAGALVRLKFGPGDRA